MNVTDDIKPISYIKTNAADMLKRVNETHNPIVITQNGEAKAVLMDTKSYQDLKNGLGILKLMAAGEKDVETGDLFENESVFRDAKDLLGNA